MSHLKIFMSQDGLWKGGDPDCLEDNLKEFGELLKNYSKRVKTMCRSGCR